MYGSLHAVVHQHARKEGRGGDGRTRVVKGEGSREKEGWEGAARKTGVEER